MNLPDTLCRTCGTELSIKTRCSECKQVNQFTCSKCLMNTDIQYHFSCTLYHVPTIQLTV